MCSSATFAGNASYISTNMLTKADLTDLESAKVQYRNLNSTFAVKNIVFYMYIHSILTAELIYTKSIEQAELNALKDIEIDFGKDYISTLQSGQKYRFEFTTTQDYDEDLSNNTGIHFLEINDDVPPKGPDIVTSGASYFNKAEFIPLNNTQKVKCVYFNNSQTETANNVTYTLDIQDSTGKSIHKVVINKPSSLAPFGATVIDFGPIPKSVFDKIKSDPLNSFPYTLVTSSKCDGDINPTNDTSKVKNLFKLEVSLEDLMKGLQKELEKKGADSRTPGYMHNERVASGKIKSEYGEGEIMINSDSYVGWLDFEYGSKFEHKTAIYAYDIDNSSIEFVESTSHPKLFDLDGMEVSWIDVNLVGEEYDIEHSVEGENIYSIGTPTNQNRVCALLVSGDMGMYLNQQEAVDRDVKIMAENLRNEELGPQLGDNNIRTEYGISFDSLYSIIKSMKGNYDKVYFYYSGGNRSVSSSMYGLFGNLSQIGADEYNILIDASYSGSLEQYLSGEYSTIDFSDAKVTMITSCRDDKAALIDTDPMGISLTAASYFSKIFGIVYGTEAADLDKDGYTSFEETFKALKIYDKEVNGNDLTVKQLPNLLKFDKPKVNKPEKKISFEGVGVTFSNVGELDIDNYFNVLLEFGYKDFVSLNPNVKDISGTRNWYLESDVENGKFELDVEFQLDYQYENLLPMMNEILGMVYRESSEEDWLPQYPSVYNKDDNTITCPGVKHFSQWAAGVISSNPSSVDSKFLINNVEYGPNPFKNVMNFEFNLDKPESFSIEVVDITGRRFDFINSQDYGVGTFSVNLDGSKYQSGTYYCRLISDSGIRTIKLVKE